MNPKKNREEVLANPLCVLGVDVKPLDSYTVVPLPRPDRDLSDHIKSDWDELAVFKDGKAYVLYIRSKDGAKDISVDGPFNSPMEAEAYLRWSTGDGVRFNRVEELWGGEVLDFRGTDPTPEAVEARLETAYKK